MSDLPVTDATLADFRAANSEALEQAAHPLHAQRLTELSALYDRRYGTPAEIVAPSASSAEYRAKHQVALNERGHADHSVRVAELTKIHERDIVNGNQPGDDLMTPANAPGDYDLSRVKASVPFGSDLVPSAEMEQQARGWMHEAGLSVAEGTAMGNLYAESLRWTPMDHERHSRSTEAGLRQNFGENAGKAAAAALRVAEESGALEFLAQSGMINHHMVVDRLVSAAKKKGYFS